MKSEKIKSLKDNIADYIIIGHSASGLSAAENIRKLDRKGKILILTYENFINYSRPLITYYLSGKVSLGSINFKEKDFFSDNNIDIWLNSKVNLIDTDKKKVILSSGDKIEFKKLLIASGGKPIIPKIKMAEWKNEKNFILNEIGEKPEGIFTLTTLDDAMKIKKYIDKNKIKEVCILGGGLIGLKAAEAFLDMGLNINLIELSDKILSTTFDRIASDIIENKIKEKNSNIFTSNTVDNIYYSDGKISGLKLKDGTKIDCRLLIIAIGVKPNIDFLNGSKIKINRGIIVDRFMRTSHDGIFAAGDVAEGLDMLSNENKNIAIWPLAVRQGAVAGINMAGGKKEYSGGFFMNSVEILKISSISLGITNPKIDNGKNVEILKDYKPEKNLYKKIVIRENKITGVVLVGSIERAGIYAGLIKNRIDISSIKENIIRDDFGLIQLPTGYRKHLVVGEGIEV